MLNLKRDTRAEAARVWSAEQARVTQQLEDLRAEIRRNMERADLLRASLNDVLAKSASLEEQGRQLSHALDHKRSAFEREMLTTADPRIARFIDQLQAEQDGLRHRLVTREGLGDRDPRTGMRMTMHSSNGDAIRALALALIQARQQAAALQSTYVPDVQVALNAIRAEIPSLEQLEAETAA